MIKFLVWVAGCAGIVYAMDRFALWHVALVNVAVWCGLLWIVGGALALGGSMVKQSSLPRPRIEPDPRTEEFVRRLEQMRRDREAGK